MTDDLVERVARALHGAGTIAVEAGHTWEIQGDEYRAVMRAKARAAVALVLEEAAKVAGKWQQMYFEDEKVHSSNITEYIVADILALAKGPQ